MTPKVGTGKLSPTQRAALDLLRQHAPHGIPTPKMLVYYDGNHFGSESIAYALNGLARRGLCNSYTQDGKRRYQLTDAGDKALAQAEGKADG